ncbi:hypothetical protein B0H14DRAFT_2260257, partial [Mycena olivaceomarginata]
QDHESHFYAALEQQLNLSPVFIKFVKAAGPLSASMPYPTHNWEEIIQIWIVALDESDEEGLLAVLECFPLIPASSSTELELLEKMWTCIRDILPRCLPEVQRAMSEAWGGVLWRLKPEAKERAVVMLAQSVVDENAGEVQDAVAWCVVYACKVRRPFLSYFLSTYIFSSPSRKLSIHHATTLLTAFSSVLNISLATPSPQMQAALLHLATALLNASPEANPAFWMGKGREVLDTVWNTGSETALLFAISLTGSLAELGWAGWR